MPKIDDEERAEEQKRAGQFLTGKQRHNLIVDIVGIVLLAIMVSALIVLIVVR